MIKTLSAAPVLVCANSLGEVPIWRGDAGTLHWVDVKVPAILRFDPLARSSARERLPGRTVGSWSFRASGGMVLAKEDGLYAYSPVDGATVRLVGVEEISGHRLNDGRCDRRGRFWVGSMHETVRDRPRGTFYCIDRDLQVTKAFDGFTVPNSVAFSPDDRTFYFADTPLRTIFAFDFDVAAGALSNRRVFAAIADGAGRPDGSTVDTDGCLWNAEYGAARIVRYTPQGKIDLVVTLPVTYPTSCAFGDSDLRTLYITSAFQNLTPAERAREPHAGDLFAVRVPAQGVPEPEFAG